MQATLEAAVDGVYAAFAGYRRPTDIDYCGHCVRPGVVEGLLAPTPLREIPAERLHNYTSDVLSTAGSLADFRYFLPRILHLAVTGGFDDHHGRDMILGKFVLGGMARLARGRAAGGHRLPARLVAHDAHAVPGRPRPGRATGLDQ